MKKIKRLLWVNILCLSGTLNAQSDTSGIKWVENLSWNLVQQKAQKENKYIFIDAFATWCGPCKNMDLKVYSNDTVADFFNDNFISVKVQMDRTKKDNDFTKSWYKDADSIQKNYKVEVYPSFIFLSPEGKIVRMEKGFKEVPQFMQLAKTALLPGQIFNDPYAEYDLLIKDFQKGIKNYDRIPYMFTCALKLGNADLALSLLKEYNRYAATLPINVRYNKDNIKMWHTTGLDIGTKTMVFKFFYNDGHVIDDVMGEKGYAEDLIDKTVKFEFINPFFKQQNKDTSVIMEGFYQADNGILKPSYEEADWKKLRHLIKRNVDRYYADKNVLWAKIEWYQRHRRYNESSGFALKYYQQYFLVESGNYTLVNTHAFNAFKYSTDKKVIDGFINLMERIIKAQDINCGFLDTYANLLYKAGRIQEAINWELRASDKAIGPFAYKQERYKKVAEQMKKGEHTWGAIWGYQ